MDIQAVQVKLTGAGYYKGAIDGSYGPQTAAAILSYAVQHELGDQGVGLGTAMLTDFARYDVSSPLRMAHFIGQGAHETQGFRFFTEYGGPSYFAKYDGRKELGNTHPGDGYAFRGRGIFMITGRYNYEVYSKRLSVDLTNHPERAADPDMATLTACVFWNDHGLSTLADTDNCEAITRKINGGLNGLAERQAYTNRIRVLLNS